MASPGRTPGDDAYWKRTRDAERLRVAPRDLRRLRARYRGLCAFCGLSEGAQLDHVVPLSLGGRHAIGNLLPCCTSCNPSKGNLTLMEWRTSGRLRLPPELKPTHQGQDV